MEAVAAQAAVALENAAMIKRIQGQFEQFVAAAVDAVEARDPATSGHSSRVAQYATNMARALNAAAESEGKPARFSEIEIQELEYAGLLHDFGKVYIDPSIFLKAKKLFPVEYERLTLRLKYLRRSLELDFALRETAMDENARRELDADRERSIAELIEVNRLIEELNEPAMLSVEPETTIDRILASSVALVAGIDDEPIPILTEYEIRNLSTKRGSLNAAERLEIEKHVVRSYEFVKRIPWPPGFTRIPEFVKSHHEMLDGSGYPDKLRGDQIPFQARMLAVADIYDALTASDRPYKKSATPEKAFSILDDEAKRGKLDQVLVDLMKSIVQAN